MQNGKHMLVKMPIYPICFPFQCLVHYFILPAQNYFANEFYIVLYNYMSLKHRDQVSIMHEQ